MNNKLSLTFILAPLLLVFWLAGCPPADACAEWKLVSGAEQMGNVFTVKSDGRRIYAGAELGVFISLDDGYTWRPTGLEHAPETMTVHQNTVYAGTPSRGVFRSDDRGETWKPRNNGLPLKFWDDGDSYYPRVRQILVTSSGTVIAVMTYLTHTSADRGEGWQDVSKEWQHNRDDLGLPDWIIGYDIESMTEFDGYLWAGTWSDIYRSPDNGHTWERVTTDNTSFSWPTDWAVLNNRLYIAAEKHYFARNKSEKGFFARYEGAHHWEVLTQGLPSHEVIMAPKYPVVVGDRPAHIETLTVNRDRIFAGLNRRGVYMFDERSETWIPAGLDGLTVISLISHQSDLYAVTDEGIYRASIPIVQPYGKAAATWGALKHEALAK